jgi:hypothetical protein
MRVPALLLLLSTAALPSSAQANTVACGGNSLSYGEVVSARRGAPRGGPVETMPDSLCADLVEHRPGAIGSIEVTIDPGARGNDPRGPVPRRP